MLRLLAIKSDQSVSAIVQDAVKYQILEDIEDIEEANKRENEPTMSFDELVSDFKREGLL